MVFGWRLRQECMVGGVSKPTWKRWTDAEEDQTTFRRIVATARLETTVYSLSPEREAGLDVAMRTTAVFNFLCWNSPQPRLLFVHGRTAIQHLEQLTNSSFPHNEFAPGHSAGVNFEILTGDYLAYRWKDNEVKRFGYPHQTFESSNFRRDAGMASHSLVAAGVNLGFDSTVMIFVTERIPNDSTRTAPTGRGRGRSGAGPERVLRVGPGRVRHTPRTVPPSRIVGRLEALGTGRWPDPFGCRAGYPARNVA